MFRVLVVMAKLSLGFVSVFEYSPTIILSEEMRKDLHELSLCGRHIMLVLDYLSTQMLLVRILPLSF
jgi:hypothetical protein